MTSREFCYWLQGYFEIDEQKTGDRVLTMDQVQTIKRHLSMVFVHEIDPSYPDKNKLNQLHAGKPTGGDYVARC